MTNTMAGKGYGWEKYMRKAEPYVPGEQPKESDVIKLNTNENPYPPAPEVERVLKDFLAERLRLYPDPASWELTQALAGTYGLSENQVFIGVGSDDVLAGAFLTFFNGDLPILFPDVTYSFYEVWAGLFQIPFQRVRLDENFRIQKEDYMRECGGIVIANPNAPTSIYEDVSEIEDIVKHHQDVVVIVDEAYIDFGGTSAASLIDRYDNLLVVQTFSKSRSLAGMRIGYAMGNPALIQALHHVKYSYNSYTMNQVSLAVGAAALSDTDYFKTTVSKITSTRFWVGERMKQLGFSFPESSANFLFATHPELSAKQIFEALREKKIFVRYWDKERIGSYLRISIGTDSQMERFLEALASLMR